jgi:hypothetical protein
MTDTDKSYPYATHLNVFYKPLELVDVPALVARGLVRVLDA